MMVICLVGSSGINMFFHHCVLHNRYDVSVLMPSNWHQNHEEGDLCNASDHCHSSDHGEEGHCNHQIVPISDLDQEQIVCCVVSHSFVKQDFVATPSFNYDFSIPFVTFLNFQIQELSFYFEKECKLLIHSFIREVDDPRTILLNLGDTSIVVALCQLKMPFDL